MSSRWTCFHLIGGIAASRARLERVTVFDGSDDLVPLVRRLHEPRIVLGMQVQRLEAPDLGVRNVKEGQALPIASRSLSTLQLAVTKAANAPISVSLLLCSSVKLVAE